MENEKLHIILNKRLALIKELNEKGWFNDLWHLTFFDDGSGDIICHVYFAMFQGEKLHRFSHFLEERGYDYYINQNAINPKLTEIHVHEKMEE